MIRLRNSRHKGLLASGRVQQYRVMPGPIHFYRNGPPEPRRASESVRVMQGEMYIRDPDWTPGPMAPPPAFKYPDVWRKQRGKKK